VPEGPGETAPGAGEDPLADLRERVRAAQEAAERLAAGGGPSGPLPPPRGWDVPHTGGPDGPAADLARLLSALGEALRTAFPRELQQPLADLVREILLAARAIIDWYLERLEARQAAPVEVEEIPID
jgi:hypothetical protein